MMTLVLGNRFVAGLLAPEAADPAPTDDTVLPAPEDAPQHSSALAETGGEPGRVPPARGSAPAPPPRGSPAGRAGKGTGKQAETSGSFGCWYTHTFTCRSRCVEDSPGASPAVPTGPGLSPNPSGPHHSPKRNTQALTILCYHLSLPRSGAHREMGPAECLGSSPL